MYANKPIAVRAQRGFSLIELMVGLVMSLLIVLAAATSGIVLAAAQRQASGTTGAATSAATALAAMKEDVAQAGLGFFSDAAYLCEGLNLSVASQNHSQADFSPLQVARTAAADRLDVVYATQVTASAGVPLKLDSDATQAQLSSHLPAVAGQAVLLAPPPGTAQPMCTVRTASTVVAAAQMQSQTLVFDGGGLHNQVGFEQPAAYPARSRAMLLDRLQWHRYRLDGDRLLLERPLTGESVVLLRDVVELRVQYGIAAPGGSGVQEWVEPENEWASLNQANLTQVRAVQIGIVKRSTEREKPGRDGTCSASTDRPQLFGRDVDAGTDWACFRYRSMTATVPLRNIILGGS